MMGKYYFMSENMVVAIENMNFSHSIFIESSHVSILTNILHSTSQINSPMNIVYFNSLACIANDWDMLMLMLMLTVYSLEQILKILFYAVEGMVLA